MHLFILGTRGIPAQHGGFETFAEQLSLFLTRRGWEVDVYCQVKSSVQFQSDYWNGIRRVHIPSFSGAAGTVAFDLKSAFHASRRSGLVLTLGYNTSIFSFLYRVRGVPHLMNMDGVEWKRAKWSASQKFWLYMSEYLGARLANHLIADHPDIAVHLQRHTSPSKITTIPYAAEAIIDCDPAALSQFGLEARQYALVVARPEPENSIHEIVSAFSRRRRGMKLVVLGNFNASENLYHKRVMEAASAEVLFPGAIYEKSVIGALRFHANVYIHGHQVGGTNPSLVEALAAGNAIFAHDNPYNSWVAGKGAVFFKNEGHLDQLFDQFLDDQPSLSRMRDWSRVRHSEEFTPERVLGAYEDLLKRFLDRPVEG